MSEISIVANEQTWHVLLIGYPASNHKLIAFPVDKHFGWDVLEKTSPSGKRLFRCKTCHRESTTPDKWCSTDPNIDLTPYLQPCPHRFRRWLENKETHRYNLTCVICGSWTGQEADVIGDANDEWAVIDMDNLPPWSTIHD